MRALTSLTWQLTLLRYGGFMWSLGRNWKTPEVKKVLVGCFGDFDYSGHPLKDMFDKNRREVLEVSRLLALPLSI